MRAVSASASSVGKSSQARQEAHPVAPAAGQHLGDHRLTTMSSAPRHARGRRQRRRRHAEERHEGGVALAEVHVGQVEEGRPCGSRGSAACAESLRGTPRPGRSAAGRADPASITGSLCSCRSRPRAAAVSMRRRGAADVEAQKCGTSTSPGARRALGQRHVALDLDQPLPPCRRRIPEQAALEDAAPQRRRARAPAARARLAIVLRECTAPGCVDHVPARRGQRVQQAADARAEAGAAAAAAAVQQPQCAEKQARCPTSSACSPPAGRCAVAARLLVAVVAPQVLLGQRRIRRSMASFMAAADCLEAWPSVRQRLVEGSSDAQ